jgi:hypothetical protein
MYPLSIRRGWSQCALSSLYRGLIQARILKEFTVEDVPQKIRELKDIRLPAVSKLLKWKNMDPKPNDSVKFRIKERLNDFGHSRLLYLADVTARTF